MNPNLPPDVVSQLRHDYERGIDALRRGGMMPIGGLCLYRDSTKSQFTISCYSSRFYVENVTKEEAAERIETAKQEIKTLIFLFPEIREQMKNLTLIFQFCHDDGKTGIVIATEENGSLTFAATVA